MGHMKFSVYFGTHIYSKGHEYAPWQYERMPHKSMVNRSIRTKLSEEAQWWIVGIDRITQCPLFDSYIRWVSYLSKTGIHVLP